MLVRFSRTNIVEERVRRVMRTFGDHHRDDPVRFAGEKLCGSTDISSVGGAFAATPHGLLPP